ncbi:MAG: UDP-4-amino-4,6-dideoxy-N-acetyl-beta-L-altrosamine transaminase [Coriobacteriales bacterium]|nr:UDP-4-amino-4,6-dideoxy-N-acetyl-beta-L-altrosamine transaminase [Coriobacteriales bacterium]
MIPYGRQSISEEDIAAVIEVLRSDLITQGPVADVFERAVADYCGVAHAVVVANGTAALHLATLALGLGPGGLLWTSPITFVASANCARYVGADVDFVDIDPATYNMSVDALAAKLGVAEAEGSLPDVVVPVHFAGASCDMAAIRELSQRYGFKVLEDAAHAIGGRYRDRPVGSCEFAEVATFSFHPVKIITSGEGGMIVTNDEEIAAHARLLHTHGVTRDESIMIGSSHGQWYYQQVALGFNYRITDIQAALGLSQMKRIDEFVARRNEIADVYREAFADLPLLCQEIPDDVLSAYHLFMIELERHDRAYVYERLREFNVGTHVHYIPVHLQPYYQDLGFRAGQFPNAEAFYDRAVTLPLYPTMTQEEVETVVSAVRTVLSE